jgi:hypothetical protein
LKRAETEYSELRYALNFLKSESANLQEISDSTDRKALKIRQLMDGICAKQIKLDQLLDESAQSLDSKLQFNVCQIKAASESLLELISVFNNCQSLSQTGFQPNVSAANGRAPQNNTFLTTNCLVQTFNRLKAKFQLDGNQVGM